MCGRYLLNAPMEALALQFQAEAQAEFAPRYNLAPTSAVPVVKDTPQGRTLTLHHWGLIPSWSRDPAFGGRLANARAETVADKPSFRGPFRRRRCVVPASGFYEWQVGDGGLKQPWLIRAASGEPLALAGLWDLWEGPEGALLSCTILTTAANAFMAPIHDRMPVILAMGDVGAWLDPASQDPKALQALLRPCAEDLLVRFKVSRRVGNVRNEGSELAEKIQ